MNLPLGSADYMIAHVELCLRVGTLRRAAAGVNWESILSAHVMERGADIHELRSPRISWSGSGKGSGRSMTP